MRRNAWALALGALLATNGFAAAQDGTATKPLTDDGFTMTLGGAGKATDAASADDTELTHWYRRGYYGGYRGYYGGYGGYGGWGGYGWGGYRSFGYAYPTYYNSFYSRPAFYPAYAYRPFYHHHHFYPRVTPYYSYYGRGYYRWIDGDADDLDAPAITLGSNAKPQPADIVLPVAPAADRPGTFRYDGGPASPVPLPKTDATSLPVSLPKSKPASPYTYKAYGEK